MLFAFLLILMFMELLEVTSDIKDLCSKNAFCSYLCTYLSEPWLYIFNLLHSQTFPVMQSNLHMLHQRRRFHPSIPPPRREWSWRAASGRRAARPADMRHAWTDITHFSFSSDAESKKKVGKMHEFWCSLAGSRRSLLWVSLAPLLAMQKNFHTVLIPSTDGCLDHLLFVKSCWILSKFERMFE